MAIPIVWVYWIVSLTIVTYTIAYIVRKFRDYGFAALVALYYLFRCIANIGCKNYKL